MVYIKKFDSFQDSSILLIVESQSQYDEFEEPSITTTRSSTKSRTI